MSSTFPKGFSQAPVQQLTRQVESFAPFHSQALATNDLFQTLTRQNEEYARKVGSQALSLKLLTKTKGTLEENTKTLTTERDALEQSNQALTTENHQLTEQNEELTLQNGLLRQNCQVLGACNETLNIELHRQININNAQVAQIRELTARLSPSACLPTGQPVQFNVQQKQTKALHIQLQEAEIRRLTNLLAAERRRNTHSG